MLITLDFSTFISVPKNLPISGYQSHPVAPLLPIPSSTRPSTCFTVRNTCPRVLQSPKTFARFLAKLFTVQETVPHCILVQLLLQSSHFLSFPHRYCYCVIKIIIYLLILGFETPRMARVFFCRISEPELGPKQLLMKWKQVNLSENFKMYYLYISSYITQFCSCV